ncbi:hypothetical protein AB0N73_02690 [Microbacterium sp. NPDC089189]|uniref:hypothetical protein n=1 Tax=Microbacterium sp. NPDC089189 TaxID=3154972 RepID=UPI0034156FF4
MSTRSRAVVRMWRARTGRSAGDRAYLAYLMLMVVIVAIAPAVRAVWVSATSAAGIAVLAAPAAPAVAAGVVAVLWACALLVGRDRGPALFAPFVTHMLATSDRPRVEAFGAPVRRAGAQVAALTTLAAGVVGASLAAAGAADPLGIALFVAAGALVGIIATVLWLAGQAFPRAAAPAALAIMLLGAVTVLLPGVLAFVPWGWVGAAYPVPGSPSGVMLLSVLAAVLVAAVPTLLTRLGATDMTAQATRWTAATALATGMDLGAAATTYQRPPHLGRRLRAVGPRGGARWAFVRRDAVGAIRTPARLGVGVVALVAAGVLLTLALAPGAPGVLLGAAGGVLLFAGLGPLTDGMRHAAYVASDLPLYGVSDEALLLGHLLLPIGVLVALLVVTVLVCAAVAGLGATPLAGALAAGVLALGARVATAVKGALPSSLLTPIPTPMGDLSAAVRLVWALDGLVLAAGAGAAAGIVLASPVPLLAVATVVAVIGVTRWRHRR